MRFELAHMEPSRRGAFRCRRPWLVSWVEDRELQVEGARLRWRESSRGSREWGERAKKELGRKQVSGEGWEKEQQRGSGGRRRDGGELTIVNPSMAACRETALDALFGQRFAWGGGRRS